MTGRQGRPGGQSGPDPLPVVPEPKTRPPRVPLPVAEAEDPMEERFMPGGFEAWRERNEPD